MKKLSPRGVAWFDFLAFVGAMLMLWPWVSTTSAYGWLLVYVAAFPIGVMTLLIRVALTRTARTASR